MELNDGTIIPSFLGAAPAGAEAHSGQIGGLGLKVGEVKEIIYPKSDKSVSKKFLEYRVIVQDTDSVGRGFATEYGNCYTSSMFGGVADKFRFTYRKQQKATKTGLGEGSKVVILCINGNTSNALIIGGLRDGVNDKENDPEDDLGHHLRWEFNGLLVNIDKDGQFLCHRRGPTDETGKVLKDFEDDGGAFIQLNQAGDVDLVDGGDGNNTIKLDHRNDHIGIEAAKGSITVKCKDEINVETTDQFINLKAKRGVNIGSAGADEPLVKGKTMRQDQKTLHNKVKSSLQMAQQMINQAGTQITQAAGLILPLTALPAKPGLIIAGQLLGQAAQSLGKVADAFDAFESAAKNHLSDKNNTD